MNERLTPESALATLAEAAGKEFVELFQHGSLVVEIYRPDGVDRQNPHTRDEIYVVISGTGVFCQRRSAAPVRARRGAICSGRCRASV